MRPTVRLETVQCRNPKQFLYRIKFNNYWTDFITLMLRHAGRLNTKFEKRDTKQIQNPKFECSKLLNFCHLIFGFVSNFGIRVSSFVAGMACLAIPATVDYCGRIFITSASAGR